MLKIASFFAGVGGIDLGFEQSGFEIVYANEFDKNAVKTYEANSKIKVDCRDINLVNANEIPDFDIMVAGFPCQAFSVAGLRQGFSDEKGRGVLFFELERIYLEKNPGIIFLENVKNLLTHDNGNTFKVISEHLINAGYNIKYKVLNSMTYGNLPQNRERIYIVCFKEKDLADKFDFPEKLQLTKSISDIINFSSRIDAKYYYTETKYPKYFSNEINMTREINKVNEIYQLRRGKYIRKNKKGVCPTLTANMGTGGHNVPLIYTDYGIRKLTPRECFLLQGFPNNFILPEISDGTLYKQSGNSVTVPVIKRIAENIKKAVED